MRVVPIMDFPLDEYSARLQKLRDQMASAQVDGVMLTQEENSAVFYRFALHSLGV